MKVDREGSVIPVSGPADGRVVLPSHSIQLEPSIKNLRFAITRRSSMVRSTSSSRLGMMRRASELPCLPLSVHILKTVECVCVRGVQLYVLL